MTKGNLEMPNMSWKLTAHPGVEILNKLGVSYIVVIASPLMEKVSQFQFLDPN